MNNDPKYAQVNTSRLLIKSTNNEIILNEEDISKLSNTTILQVAMQLEDALVHSCDLDENMSALEFIKYYLE